jgi:PAS domain S-box-containing protein
VESERRFRTLFEQAAVGVAEIDPLSGRFLRVNKRYCDIVGLSRDEMLKTDFQSLTHPEDLAADLNNMKLLLAGEIREFYLEKRYIRNDGDIVWVNLTVYPTWLWGESPSRHIAIIEDITERKKAEEELRKYRVHLEDLVSERTGELKAANEKLKELDKLKSMFIASMSHELRTPLNSIIGFTGMTLQGLSGELNGEQKDNLSRAYQAAKHLLSLITDVIDISKIEAGRIESYPEVVSLDNIIDEAIGTVSPQLKEKGLELAVEVPGDVQLNTDRKRLLQCLLNFLSNAVKFTESGTITVAARETDGEVMISVSDTGIGIAGKDQSKVFEAFERLETHLRVKAGGTGLGLYLTKKLARDILRGDVLFQSKEGQGSTFTLRVPKDLRQNPVSADMPDTTGDIG